MNNPTKTQTSINSIRNLLGNQNMKQLVLKITFAFAVILCVNYMHKTAFAQTTGGASDVPHVISYQGLLSNTDGSAVSDGTHTLTVTALCRCDGYTNAMAGQL